VTRHDRRSACLRSRTGALQELADEVENVSDRGMKVERDKPQCHVDGGDVQHDGAHQHATRMTLTERCSLQFQSLRRLTRELAICATPTGSCGRGLHHLLSVVSSGSERVSACFLFPCSRSSRPRTCRSLPLNARGCRRRPACRGRRCRPRGSPSQTRGSGSLWCG
jgi:hypothetical protein